VAVGTPILMDQYIDMLTRQATEPCDISPREQNIPPTNPVNLLLAAGDLLRA